MLILEISNISQLAPISDYEVKVWVNNRLIAQGVVEGHERAAGWRKLLSRIANGSQIKDESQVPDIRHGLVGDSDPILDHTTKLLDINWLDRLRNAAR